MRRIVASWTRYLNEGSLWEIQIILEVFGVLWRTKIRHWPLLSRFVINQVFGWQRRSVIKESKHQKGKTGRLLASLEIEITLEIFSILKLTTENKRKITNMVLKSHWKQLIMRSSPKYSLEEASCMQSYHGQNWWQTNSPRKEVEEPCEKLRATKVIERQPKSCRSRANWEQGGEMKTNQNNRVATQ